MVEWLYMASAGGVLLAIWWVLAAVLVSDYAGDKGRSKIGFFVMAMVFNPMFVALLLIAAPDLRRARRESELAERQAKDFRAGIESLWKQLEAIRQQLARQSVITAPASGDEAAVATTPTPVIVSAMGYCPGCQRLRGLNSPKCIYCNTTEPARETK